MNKLKTRHLVDSLPAVAVVSIALLSLATICASPLKADANVAFFVESGRRILQGDIPYIDMFNHNLLTIQYLFVVPVALAEALGVHAISVWLALTWLQLALSMLLCYRLSRKLFPESAVPGASLIAPLCLALVSWHCRHESMFALREHVFLIYATPWLLLRFGRWEGLEYRGALALAFGFLAGIMATIKPHFLLALGLLELYWILRQRRLRPLFAPETVGLFGACLAYALYLLLNPEVLTNMLAVIRSSMEFYAHHTRITTTDVIARPMFALPALAGVGALIGQFAGEGRRWRMLGVFGGFTIAGASLVVMQVGGIMYRHIPLWAGAAMCIGWGIVLLLWTARGRHLGAIFALLALLCGAHTAASWSSLTELWFKTPDDLRQLVYANSSPGDETLFISYQMGIVYPWLAVAGRHQSDSMRDAWYLPQPHDTRDVARHTLERYAASAAGDIARSPQLIVVDDRALHAGWRIWDFLEKYELLNEIAMRYMLAGRTKRFIVFRYIGSPPVQASTFSAGELFHLLAWDLPPRSAPLAPCDALDITTWWQASDAPDANRYSLHIDLLNAEDGSLAHESHWRLGNLPDYSLLPTIIDQRELEVACDASGQHHLLLSLEDIWVEGGALLPTRDSHGADYGRYIYLGTYEIASSKN